MSETYEEKLERARKALYKEASYGPDVDIDKFLLEKAGEESGQFDLSKLPEEDKERAIHAGIIPSGKGRSGTYFQSDTNVLCARPSQEGLEVMSTTSALKKYGWLKDIIWSAASPDADKYTAAAALHRTHGYLIRAKSGVKTTFPVQACLYIGKKNTVQRVHNILIAEPGSELNIITGCTTSAEVKSAMHIGISEFFIRKGAKITFTMVHSWEKDVHVRPRTAAIIEEGGTFINNYICLREVSSIQMLPKAYLIGNNANTRMTSILYGLGNSNFDVGGKAFLRAPGAGAEIISRVIADDNSKITARGNLVGESENVKGHVECQGLMLSDTANAIAIPELDARKIDMELTHEAAVGKLAEDQILYLMARGLSSEQATSL